MDNLLSCPFCGREAFLEFEEYWSDCAERPTYYYGIGYKTSGCFCGLDEFYFETELEAINQWNRRNHGL